jgi:predicted Zn-dependent protease
MDRSRGHWRAGWALTLTLLCGCATNPVTGRPQLVLMSEAQEIALGRESDPQISAGMGLYEDEALQRYVEGVAMPMARASERPGLPWQFRVVDDPAVNAFALPGGFIYVTRGILAHMASEAELAGVLGHEIGHVTARHSVPAAVLEVRPRRRAPVRRAGARLHGARRLRAERDGDGLPDAGPRDAGG